MDGRYRVLCAGAVACVLVLGLPSAGPSLARSGPVSQIPTWGTEERWGEPTSIPIGSATEQASGDGYRQFLPQAMAGFGPVRPGVSGLPAFPGAEGFGADTPGGRGGRVIEVTNLDDSGLGSLRACIETSVPRVCVFRVAGTISVKDNLEIRDPYITIAGQTAPGGGITLKNDPLHDSYTIEILTHDVVIRHIRIRPGPSSQESSTLRALTAIGSGAHDIVIDHCSMSWATDETFSTWYGAHDVTVQWSIISEGLNCSTHSEGCHSKGPVLGSSGSYNLSFHHNLMAHNAERNPLVKAGGGTVDVVNNVAYNAKYSASPVVSEYAYLRVNYVGNYYRAGANSTSGSYFVSVHDDWGNGAAVFVHGNISPHLRPSDDLAENLVVKGEDRGFVIPTRHTAPSVSLFDCESAADCEVLEQVLARAGALMRLSDAGGGYLRRDAVDRRIVEEVRRGEGRVIDAPCQARNFTGATQVLTPADYTRYGIDDPFDADGCWPVLSPGTPYADGDHDGMGDEWEIARGFDPSNAADGPQDRDGDGYTNLEEFLNGTAP